MGIRIPHRLAPELLLLHHLLRIVICQVKVCPRDRRPQGRLAVRRHGVPPQGPSQGPRSPKSSMHHPLGHGGPHRGHLVDEEGLCLVHLGRGTREDNRPEGRAGDALLLNLHVCPRHRLQELQRLAPLADGQPHVLVGHVHRLVDLRARVHHHLLLLPVLGTRRHERFRIVRNLGEGIRVYPRLYRDELLHALHLRCRTLDLDEPHVVDAVPRRHLERCPRLLLQLPQRRPRLANHKPSLAVWALKHHRHL
mmetsp:Transcript_49584/g.120285  ORF Transcript_49584/g.120285 Transcript_49584/m.120285 type:complete len:251 (-) Transcript_49584:336-1088(-)